jgi:hypothetical protein
MNKIINVRSPDMWEQSRADPRLTASRFGESLALDRYARRLDSQEARVRLKLATLNKLMEQET